LGKNHYWKVVLNILSLDPRSKLIATFTAAVSLISLNRPMGLALAFAILLAAIVIMRLGRSWMELLKGLGFAVGSFFFIVWLAFDLQTGIAAALRLLTIATVFFLFFQTTSPEALSNALIKMGVPYSFAFVLSTSMQFVHVLARRASNIRDAQRARGIPLDKGIRFIRHLPAIAGPLLIQAFKIADELAEAMEARGFKAPGRRFRHEPRFKLIDWLVAGMSMATLAIIIVVSWI